MFCHNNKVFLFCLPKRCSRLKKGGSGSRLRPTKNRLRLHPNSGGSSSATLEVKVYKKLLFNKCSNKPLKSVGSRRVISTIALLYPMPFLSGNRQKTDGTMHSSGFEKGLHGWQINHLHMES